MQSIQSGVVLTLNIRTSDWPPQSSSSDHHRRTWFTVPMTYIEKLFQKSTWASKAESLDPPRWRIPRTGAVSLYINSFTTMHHSEELRSAREDAAEAIAIERSQPAPKKRVISSENVFDPRPSKKYVHSHIIVERQSNRSASSRNKTDAKQERYA